MCLAIPGKILSVTGEDPLTRSARVSFGGIVKEISLGCTPEAKIGDYVLVHVGFALSVVDEAEANQVFEYLRQMDELQELEESPAPLEMPPTKENPTC
jgi:hydrogenase expression/formation protein HypC